MTRFKRAGILFRSSLLVCLGSCGISNLSAGFQTGARMQESLDNGTLELMDRSPSVASGDFSLLASSGNLSVIDRSPRITLAFSGLTDFRSEIGNDDLTVYESYYARQAPTFFEWAGKFISWRENPDYQIIFAYYHAQKTIEYVDFLFEEDLLPMEYVHFWKEQPSGFAPAPPVPVGQILPALPLTIYAAETRDPDGNTLGAESTHFCPNFNVNFRTNGEDYCIDNTSDDFDDLKLEDGAVKRVMTFYRHQATPVPYFNPADDADTIYHEMGHVLQLAMNNRALENPVATNGHMDAILEGLADFFAGAMTDDSELFRYSLANFKAAFPDSFAGGSTHNQRDLNNVLRFPEAFVGLSDMAEAPHVGNSHMSGRVIAGLLYDMKLLYDGETPASVDEYCADAQFSGLAICSSVFTPISPDPNWRSWDVVLALALRTLAGDGSADPLDVDYSTFQHFGEKLHDECVARAVTFLCPEQHIEDLLVLRGLTSDLALYPPAIVGALPIPYDTEPERIWGVGPTTAGDTSPDDWGLTSVDSNMGHIDYQPDYSGAPVLGYWANGDSVVDPCEVMVIYPNIVNRTHIMEARARGALDTSANPATTGAEIYDIKVELSDFDGFLPFEIEDTLIEDVSEPGYVDHRIIPWLKPGEATGVATVEDLLGDRDAYSPLLDPDSGVFEIHQDYRLSKKISKMRASSSLTDFPTNIGWILRAPATAAAVASATFKVHYKVFNQKFMADTAAAEDGISQQTYEFTQSLTVTGPESFCDR
jgi:hypothetical protein